MDNSYFLHNLIFVIIGNRHWLPIGRPLQRVWTDLLVIDIAQGLLVEILEARLNGHWEILGGEYLSIEVGIRLN